MTTEEQAAIDAAVNEKLAAMIRSYQQPAASAPQPMALAPQQPAPMSAFGMPAPQPMGGGFGMPAPQQPAAGMGMGMGMNPQPTGCSVPVTVPLPDGREVSCRVTFGPEAVQNLPAVVAACAQMFGDYLQARAPYRRGWGNGGGGGGGGGWSNGGNRGGWQGRGRW